MTTKLNTDKLDKLLKALKENKSRVLVGILGQKAKNAHPGSDGKPSGLTNAELGAIHEFGSGSNPVRSFLRVPLADHLGRELKRIGLLNKDLLKKVIAQGSFKPFLEKIGIVGESIVLEAFASGGYGEWQPSDMSRKKVHMTLVETHQLRDSITSKVTDE